MGRGHALPFVVIGVQIWGVHLCGLRENLGAAALVCRLVDEAFERYPMCKSMRKAVESCLDKDISQRPRDGTSAKVLFAAAVDEALWRGRRREGGRRDANRLDGAAGGAAQQALLVGGAALAGLAFGTMWPMLVILASESPVCI